MDNIIKNSTKILLFIQLLTFQYSFAAKKQVQPQLIPVSAGEPIFQKPVQEVKSIKVENAEKKEQTEEKKALEKAKAEEEKKKEEAKKNKFIAWIKTHPKEFIAYLIGTAILVGGTIAGTQYLRAKKRVSPQKEEAEAEYEEHIVEPVKQPEEVIGSILEPPAQQSTTSLVGQEPIVEFILEPQTQIPQESLPTEIPIQQTLSAVQPEQSNISEPSYEKEFAEFVNQNQGKFNGEIAQEYLNIATMNAKRGRRKELHDFLSDKGFTSRDIWNEASLSVYRQKFLER